MKFHISSGSLLNSLVKLNCVVPSSSHSTLPIISNIYFELKGDTLRMVSTDIETFISTSIKVEGVKDGAVAVPARKILDLVKALITKTEYVTEKIKLDSETFEKIKGNPKLSPVLIDKFSYSAGNQTLSYKGGYPAGDREKLDSWVAEAKEHLGDEGMEEFIPAFEKLIDTLEKLLNLAEKAFQKITDKIKIKFESDEKNKITITSKNGKYSFFGEPVEDYPLPDDRSDLNMIDIDGNLLRRSLLRAKHSVKYDEIRRNMSGVFFEIGKNEIHFVATDGFRLSKIVSKNFKSGKVKDAGFIVPVKTCDLLPRLLTEGNVNIGFDDSMIKFSFGNIILYSKLIDDTFPKYESVIPKDNDKKLLVNRVELSSALRRALIFTDNITRRVKFELAGNIFVIKADNPEIGGEGEETLTADFKKNNGDSITEPFSIAFNVVYLLECLQQIDTEEVLFTFNTPSKASIIYPVGSTDDEYMELIMPVRVG